MTEFHGWVTCNFIRLESEADILVVTLAHRGLEHEKCERIGNLGLLKHLLTYRGDLSLYMLWMVDSMVCSKIIQ